MSCQAWIPSSHQLQHYPRARASARHPRGLRRANLQSLNQSQFPRLRASYPRQSVLRTKCGWNGARLMGRYAVHRWLSHRYPPPPLLHHPRPPRRLLRTHRRRRRHLHGPCPQFPSRAGLSGEPAERGSKSRTAGCDLLAGLQIMWILSRMKTTIRGRNTRRSRRRIVPTSLRAPSGYYTSIPHDTSHVSSK